MCVCVWCAEHVIQTQSAHKAIHSSFTPSLRDPRKHPLVQQKTPSNPEAAERTVPLRSSCERVTQGNMALYQMHRDGEHYGEDAHTSSDPKGGQVC